MAPFTLSMSARPRASRRFAAHARERRIAYAHAGAALALAHAPLACAHVLTDG
jgi:hypothetical protein